MIVPEMIMKLNIVQGLRPNTYSRKIPGFHRGGVGGGGGAVQSQDTTLYTPCIVIIYLEYT